MNNQIHKNIDTAIEHMKQTERSRIKEELVKKEEENKEAKQLKYRVPPPIPLKSDEKTTK